MKKKIILFIFLLLFIIAPSTVVKATITGPGYNDNTCLNNFCLIVCNSSDLYASTEQKQWCYSSCQSQYQSLVPICGCVDQSTVKCYANTICDSGAFSNSGTCVNYTQSLSFIDENCRSACNQIPECKTNPTVSCNNICTNLAKMSDCNSVECFRDTIASNNLCANTEADTECEKLCNSYAVERGLNSAICNKVCEKAKENCYGTSGSVRTGCFKNSICTQRPDICPVNSGSSESGTSDGSGDEKPTEGSSSQSSYDVDKMNPENCYGFGEVVYYVTLIVKILQIAAPILLILWASIDLLRSIIAGDEKKIIEKRKPIIRRFIAAVLVFLVPWIVNSIVSSVSSSTDWITCWKNNTAYTPSNSPSGSSNTEETGKIKTACRSVCQNYAGDRVNQCANDCVVEYLNAPSCASTQENACYNSFAKSWLQNNNGKYK